MEEERYIQTWQHVCKLPKMIRKPIQWLCGLRGHEWSKTESGYAGGNKADVWCRWCNRHAQIPADESPFADEWRGLF